MALDTPGPLGSGGFWVLRVFCYLVCFDSKRTPIKWSLTFYLQHRNRCSDKEVPSQPPSFIPKMLQGKLRNNWNPRFLWGRNNVLTIAATKGSTSLQSQSACSASAWSSFKRKSRCKTALGNEANEKATWHQWRKRKRQNSTFLTLSISWRK